ncbi:MAG: endonuclease/exonuclease/phosphatase family protein [Hyphomonadaceae bacterium]
MRIGVWNLECVNHKERNAARLAFLLERDVDIWVLTETHQEIDLSPSHKHAARSEPRAKSRNNMHWVSIWSRFPVIESVPSGDVRTAISLLKTPEGPMMVYGTVWPWHTDRGEHPGDQSIPNWARQAPVIVEQRRQWSRLKAKWPDAALCIAGDLNMTFGGPGSYYSRDGRLEAALAMQSHDLVCTTAWARLPIGALDKAPIDHVLLPHELAMRTRVCDTWRGVPRDPNRLSDHSGLIVEIAPVV